MLQSGGNRKEREIYINLKVFKYVHKNYIIYNPKDRKIFCKLKNEISENVKSQVDSWWSYITNILMSPDLIQSSKLCHNAQLDAHWSDSPT
jgi:hypothetical protein